MSENKISLGQAIDKVIEALEPLDPTSRLTAINAACDFLSIEAGQRTFSDPPADKVDAPRRRSQIDIRSFKEEKNPKSAVHMACVVAFYLQELAPESDRKSTVNSEDLEKYFKQAQFKLPKAIPQLLVDAKAAGYFETAVKGEYRLNAVGYNLVAHNFQGNRPHSI